MCRANVDPAAERALAAVMLDICDALAVHYGCDPEAVTVGPVEFGPDRADLPYGKPGTSRPGQPGLDGGLMFPAEPNYCIEWAAG